MPAFKRAKDLRSGDRVRVQAESKTLGQLSVETIFLVGTMPGERGKPAKAQHVETGNVAKGVHLIFEDGGEALLHPDERIEVFP